MLLTKLKSRHRGVVLELEEGSLQEVLGADIFDAHEVEDHIVRQVEGTRKIVSAVLKNMSRHARVAVVIRKHTVSILRAAAGSMRSSTI